MAENDGRRESCAKQRQHITETSSHLRAKAEISAGQQSYSSGAHVAKKKRLVVIVPLPKTTH